MIGRVDSKMPGFIFVHINVGSRYRKGRTIPVPEQIHQPYPVHRLQVQAVTGPLPEFLKGQKSFPLFTDKPDKYPDFAHPDNQKEFGAGPDARVGGQLAQARRALGVPDPQAYDKSRDFLLGGRPPGRPHDPDQGSMGY